ncbi:hypothetical protein Pcinc_003727 [Petrolisthes cinctipes]|uniref:Uncharacterized protein n=1 Tax=Petrolisthes cinctipes TaxID=88211 RepID=A0AAE1GIH9_PETCI|nr:hypothetical protein Pcinc_003727 [Petrolisthes cinctipes]
MTEIEWATRGEGSDVKKKAAKERSEIRVTGGGIPDTKDWKPTEEAMLALIETEAIEGISGPCESEDITADEPLPSTSAGSVVRPMPLTGTLDEHAPQPNEPQSTSDAARARPLSTTFHLEPSTSWDSQGLEDILVAVDDTTRHSTILEAVVVSHWQPPAGVVDHLGLPHPHFLQQHLRKWDSAPHTFVVEVHAGHNHLGTLPGLILQRPTRAVQASEAGLKGVQKSAQL